MRSLTPFIIGFEGTILDERLSRHLLRLNPAGVLLFKRNITSIPQVSRLIQDIRDLLGDIIISIDHEGGIVNRFPDEVPVPPSARSLRIKGDEKMLRQACRLQANLLASIGVNLNFAPVVDLDLDSKNHVIGCRAFSSNPEEVNQYLRVIFEEHQKVNVGITAKHFPSHGRSLSDSHIESGDVETDMATLRLLDFSPYREAEKLGIPAVMTAHLRFKDLDPGLPATLSHRWIQGVLREELGFKGLIISDCVEMSAVGDHYSPEDLVNRGFGAGLDLMISAYSLNKSTEFQDALVHAYDRYQANNEGSTGEFDTRDSRISAFIKQYSPQRVEFDFSGEKKLAEEIHRGVIFQCGNSSGFPKCKSIQLIEISNNRVEGINADEKLSRVGEVLVNQYHRIESYSVISQGDGDRFKQTVEEANANQRIVLLLTSGLSWNADIPSLLDAAHFSIHAALNGPGDISGKADLELVSHGSNYWTAIALQREMEARCFGPKGKALVKS